jgi:alanyl-tRNA synthetase
VKAYFPSPSALKRLKYRSKVELDENVRIVKIKGCDVCACCTPHVSRTGEIGIIKLLGHERRRGGVRISMLCGLDALEDYRKRLESTAEISALLSAKQREVATAVRRLLDELGGLKLGLAEARKQLVMAKAALLPETDENLVFFEPELDPDSLRELVTLGMARCGGVCAGFTGAEGDWKYVIGSRNADLRKAAKEINKALNGRGGGRPEMIQGAVSCSKKDIEEYFNGKAIF